MGRENLSVWVAGWTSLLSRIMHLCVHLWGHWVFPSEVRKEEGRMRPLGANCRPSPLVHQGWIPIPTIPRWHSWVLAGILFYTLSGKKKKTKPKAVHKKKEKRSNRRINQGPMGHEVSLAFMMSGLNKTWAITNLRSAKCFWKVPAKLCVRESN